MGHGHSNFCLLDAEIDNVTDRWNAAVHWASLESCCSCSVTVGVDILDVSKVYEMGRGEIKVSSECAHLNSLRTPPFEDS